MSWYAGQNVMLDGDLARIRTFEIVPSLPESIALLGEIARNVWWSWHPEAVELFVRVDRELWQGSNHNPVQMLGRCPQDRLDALSRDDGFITALHRAHSNLERHLNRTSWLARHPRYSRDADFTVAYFSAEFALTECLQIYSGGLGCLAGDHLKSAAELALPLVGVGLLYRHGYFQQYLNADGWQQEYYADLDLSNLPIQRVLDADGRQLKIQVELAARNVHAAIWQVNVGRVALYLLDTNVPENETADRLITSQLYGGDMETRIKQEILLGIGGVRALDALGIDPDVIHMNEGHSAFGALERVRRTIDTYGVSFDEARQFTAAANIFTTHTPVAAGIDRFHPDIIRRYFKHYHASLKLDMEGLLALGRENVFDKDEFFSMAVLAIRMSNSANGVSRLHGKISRSMWQNIWPGVPEEDIPIGHVNNGVHARSWMSSGLINLVDRYLGAVRWQHDPADLDVWSSITEVPDDELWRIHERCRQRLVLWTRRRYRAQLESHGAEPERIEAAGNALDFYAFTIGFARRFATYKRANLILRDIERLVEMLSDAKRPVQLIVAGKAHPADTAGKELIREMIQATRRFDGEPRIVFIENYDINVARYLVQGCDLWLNTPRRGLEASGTSGMKAALNGVLNCSVLDGWWDEAYRNDLGWAIGRGEVYANEDLQDEVESQALYDLLEQQIIPLFYSRDNQDVPRQWVGRMKQCISTLAPAYNTNRMVQAYTEQYYVPAYRRSAMLRADALENAIGLAGAKERLRECWPSLRVDQVDANTETPLGVHQQLSIAVVASLGSLAPDELRVQAYVGLLDNDDRVSGGQAFDLTHVEDLGDGRHRFRGAVRMRTSGRHGFAIRIIPGGDMFQGVTEPGLIFWDKAPMPTFPSQEAIGSMNA